MKKWVVGGWRLGIGHRSLDIGHRSLVIGHWSSVTELAEVWTSVIGHQSSVIGDWILTYKKIPKECYYLGIGHWTMVIGH